MKKLLLFDALIDVISIICVIVFLILNKVQYVWLLAPFIGIVFAVLSLKRRSLLAKLKLLEAKIDFIKIKIKTDVSDE